MGWFRKDPKKKDLVDQFNEQDVNRPAPDKTPASMWFGGSFNGGKMKLTDPDEAIRSGLIVLIVVFTCMAVYVFFMLKK